VKNDHQSHSRSLTMLVTYHMTYSSVVITFLLLFPIYTETLVKNCNFLYERGASVDDNQNFTNFCGARKLECLQ